MEDVLTVLLFCAVERIMSWYHPQYQLKPVLTLTVTARAIIVSRMTFYVSQDVNRTQFNSASLILAVAVLRRRTVTV